MARTISIGAQSFADIREHGYFLVDKTDFLRQWWAAGDTVTLICRPRRFGKTLTMSMVECFFSNTYANRDELFEGLGVWDDPTMREEQGAWPVVALSFASIKAPDYAGAKDAIKREIARLYARSRDLLEADLLDDNERAFFNGVRDDMPDGVAALAINRLCEFLQRQTGRRAIVLLDEYDTPLQEAWLRGYWDEMSSFTRQLFNATFKTNRFLERALVTGITRVAEESIFSDMNNPKVVTVTSKEYADCLGFTEGEVFASMEEYGLSDKEEVRHWYDGFTFGDISGIYNPWSVTNYLDTGGQLAAYWVNTSGNGLVARLLREGDVSFKQDFEALLRGETVYKALDERVVFKDLGKGNDAIWPLLLASGYLKVVSRRLEAQYGQWSYGLEVTNFETMTMFNRLICHWFGIEPSGRTPFVKALLSGDLDAMNDYMTDLAETTISSFDSGTQPSIRRQPERFWHGLVLGMLVELRGVYHVRSNPESGHGRCDVLLEPFDPATHDGIIIEFKVRDARRGEATLADTLATAKGQIERNRYAAELETRGVPADRIRTYGFAFDGTDVLIG